MSVKSIENGTLSLNNLIVDKVNGTEYTQASQGYLNNTQQTYTIPNNDSNTHTFWSDTLDAGTYLVSVEWGIGNQSGGSTTFNVLRLDFNYQPSAGAFATSLTQSNPNLTLANGFYPKYTYTMLVQQATSGAVSLSVTEDISSGFSSNDLFISVFYLNIIKVF